VIHHVDQTGFAPFEVSRKRSHCVWRLVEDNVVVHLLQNGTVDYFFVQRTMNRRHDFSADVSLTPDVIVSGGSNRFECQFDDRRKSAENDPTAFYATAEKLFFE